MFAGRRECHEASPLIDVVKADWLDQCDAVFCFCIDETKRLTRQEDFNRTADALNFPVSQIFLSGITTTHCGWESA